MTSDTNSPERLSEAELDELLRFVDSGNVSLTQIVPKPLGTGREVLRRLIHQARQHPLQREITERDHWLSDNAEAILEVLEHGSIQLAVRASNGINTDRERARHDAIREIASRYVKLVKADQIISSGRGGEAVAVISDLLDDWAGYSQPSTDRAILFMQTMGLDRWSMQSSVERDKGVVSSINCHLPSALSVLPIPEGGK